jgi:CDP-6-deoxy-D-xylo-4-hexulose-3-dehydrase
MVAIDGVAGRKGSGNSVFSNFQIYGDYAMALNLPLMRNNILREDLDAVIAHLRQPDPILTQSKNVRAFEEEWSRWLGVSHSVFVNSGASANLLSMAVLRLRHPEGGEVIVPPLAWVSDIASVLQNGFTPVFVDIDPLTLGMDATQIIARLNARTRAVFLTHVQGFDALTDELLRELQRRDIPLIEDVCEAHGATHNGRKLGSFGWMSNFSYYYAHHMSTIEGGMICTDDAAVYQQLRMLRSHGMVRESDDAELRGGYQRSHSDLNPDFIFAFPSYNVRNTEIGGIFGRSQLKRLDEIVRLRNRNLKVFLRMIDSTAFRTDFRMEGCSNYAFNLILREPDVELAERLMAGMREERIEFRRGSAGGGNQLRQPYLRGVIPQDEFSKYPQVDHVHFFGFYIGNFPDLEEKTVMELCGILNSCVR